MKKLNLIKFAIVSIAMLTAVNGNSQNLPSVVWDFDYDGVTNTYQHSVDTSATISEFYISSARIHSPSVLSYCDSSLQNFAGDTMWLEDALSVMVDQTTPELPNYYKSSFNISIDGSFVLDSIKVYYLVKSFGHGGLEIEVLSGLTPGTSLSSNAVFPDPFNGIWKQATFYGNPNPIFGNKLDLKFWVKRSPVSFIGLCGREINPILFNRIEVYTTQNVSTHLNEVSASEIQGPYSVYDITGQKIANKVNSLPSDLIVPGLYILRTETEYSIVVMR